MTKVRFILVDTAFPSNMGAAARAIKAMGFDDLVFVRPKRSPLHERAMLTATHADDLLKRAPIVGSLAEAMQGLELVLATSNRNRLQAALRWTLPELSEQLQCNPRASLGLVFGNETTGLMSNDVKMCHGLMTIPAAVPLPSLNLAQAVMVAAYELSRAKGVDGKTLSNMGRPSSEQELGVLRDRVCALLTSCSVGEEDSLMRETLARLPLLGKDEVRLVFKILQTIDQKIGGSD